MENKANAISYRNRGVSQQAMARIAPSTTASGAAAKRPVHEIHVEDIQKVDQKERQDASRRLTRQKSRTINEQVSQEERQQRNPAPKKNVKFGMDDSFNIT